jgi:hypothetical protein
MNKKLIQQLLEDDETRLEIASLFGFKMEGDDCHRSSWDYDDIMVETLNEASDTLAVGDMITIEASDYMWVRGGYLRNVTPADGRVVVLVPTDVGRQLYTGKRVGLVVKGEEEKTT